MSTHIPRCYWDVVTNLEMGTRGSIQCHLSFQYQLYLFLSKLYLLPIPAVAVV